MERHGVVQSGVARSRMLLNMCNVHLRHWLAEQDNFIHSLTRRNHPTSCKLLTTG